MQFILFFVAIFLVISTPTFARPVSYPGGWTAMQMNDGTSNSVHIHYSPTAKYSIGYKGEYFRENNWQLQAAQLNYLAKRWNRPQSQANVYIKSAIGAAVSNKGNFNNHWQEAGFTGFAADWETRRFYTSYENRLVYAGDIDKFFSQKARIGVAPYIGDYGDIHSWIMVELNHNPESRGDKTTVTPLLRMFKDVYLFEAGYSSDHKILFNAVVRF